jgi:PadR family transcriptional regulator, regulatory protein PadR
MVYDAPSKPSPNGEESGEPGRWEAQLRKGTLEMAILAILWEKKLYGLEILRVLESSFHLSILEGTLYLILNRLRRAGIVRAEWVDSGQGHPRKYYRLSSNGRERLTKMAEFWRAFSANLEGLIAPVRERKEWTHAE